MKKPKHRSTFEKGILLLQKKGKDTSVSVEKILEILSGKGKSLILILLSLPFCQPLQIPGLSIPFGLAIAFVGFRMAFGKNVWLPKRILKKTLKPETLKKMTDKALVFVHKINRLVHPRLEWLCNFPFMHMVNGLTVALLGLFLAIPLPIPLTNLIASWSIILISIGLLKDDGVFVLIGYFISFLTILFFIFMLFTFNHFFTL